MGVIPSFSENRGSSKPDPAVLGGALVTVTYSFLEVDWFSPDDPGYCVSPGVLFTSRDDRALVVVARSGIDGTWIAKDATGEPEIENELWRVTLPDGSVYSAQPIWTEESGGDLALLSIEGTPPKPTAPLSVVHRSSAPIEIIDWIDGRRRHVRGTLDSEDRPSGIDGSSARGVVLQESRAVGIVGRRLEDQSAMSWTPFSKLPVALQPKPSAGGG